MGRRAVALLTPTSAHPSWLALLSTMTRENPAWDAFVVSDAEPLEGEESLVDLGDGCSELRVASWTCRLAGFSGSGTRVIPKTPISWDKACYFFAERRRGAYEHVWFVEDDVLLGAAAALIHLDARLGAADLACAVATTEAEDPWWPHWRKTAGEPSAADVFPGPPQSRARAMMCVARMSAALLEAVSEYAAAFRRLQFLEHFFPTLALRKGLHVDTDAAFRNVRWRFYGDELQDALSSSTFADVFHPVKDQDTHDVHRNFLARLASHGAARPSP